jgi:hypothetical protein
MLWKSGIVFEMGFDLCLPIPFHWSLKTSIATASRNPFPSPQAEKQSTASVNGSSGMRRKIDYKGQRDGRMGE